MAAIALTKEQQRLVEFVPQGNLLIRGEAGSGKTTVLAARAGRIKEINRDGRMLFITYNRSLVGYVTMLMARSGLAGEIDILTFHEWARKFVDELGGPVGMHIKEKKKEEKNGEFLGKIAPQWSKNHLNKQPLDFWLEEINWIFGQAIETFEEYMKKPRTGRGTAVQVRGEDRAFVWEVFKQYRNYLLQENLVDLDDPAWQVLRTVRERGGFLPEQQYDHVFIDEVQDFNLSWLMCLSPIPKVSLTLAGDLAQRIYRRNFTWKEAGLEIPAARSHKLLGSHRTTKQIMQVALHVATNYDLQSNEDYIPPTLPERSGPKVIKIERETWWDAQDAALRFAAKLSRQYPGERVVVADFFNKRLSEIVQRLRSIGANAMLAKREDFKHFFSGVLVTTYHQLKGLEFEHIVLLSLEDRTMPEFFFQRSDSELPVEKEQYLRRLLYVAMTRSKKTLTLCGGRPFSRFFKDVPADLFVMI